MHRTTVPLKDQIFEKLQYIAQQENRSTPNLIETILLHYLDQEIYADPFEMEETRRDMTLQKELKKGIADYKSKKGRFV